MSCNIFHWAIAFRFVQIRYNQTTNARSLRDACRCVCKVLSLLTYGDAQWWTGLGEQTNSTVHCEAEGLPDGSQALEEEKLLSTRFSSADHLDTNAARGTDGGGDGSNGSCGGHRLLRIEDTGGSTILVGLVVVFAWRWRSWRRFNALRVLSRSRSLARSSSFIFCRRARFRAASRRRSAASCVGGRESLAVFRFFFTPATVCTDGGGGIAGAGGMYIPAIDVHTCVRVWCVRLYGRRNSGWSSAKSWR